MFHQLHIENANSVVWAPGSQQHARSESAMKPLMEAEDETQAAVNPGERGRHAIFKPPFHERELHKLLTAKLKKVRLDFQTPTDVCMHFRVFNTRFYVLDILIHFLSSFTSPKRYHRVLWREKGRDRWGAHCILRGNYTVPSMSVGLTAPPMWRFVMPEVLLAQSPSVVNLG